MQNWLIDTWWLDRLAYASPAILKAGCCLRFGDGFPRPRLRSAWRLFGELETDFAII